MRKRQIWKEKLAERKRLHQEKIYAPWYGDPQAGIETVASGNYVYLWILKGEVISAPDGYVNPSLN